jgi:hypothetical protein
MNSDDKNPMVVRPIHAILSARARFFIDRVFTDNGMIAQAANKAVTPIKMPMGPIANAGSSRQPK